MSFMDMFRVDEIKAQLKRAVGELRKAEKERDSAKSELEKTLDELAKTEKEYNSAKSMLADVDKMEYQELKQVNANLNAQKEKAKSDLQQFNEWFAKRKQNADQQLIDINKQIELMKKEIVVLDDEILLQSFGFYEQHYSFQNSEQYRLKLEEIRAKQQWLIKTEKAVTFPDNVSLMGSLADGEKMIKDYVMLILRSFNNECDSNIINVKFSNVKSIEKKIFKDYDALNKLGKRMNISIVKEYLDLKLDELYLCYEYQVKKQDEKEEQKRVKEQMREEAKLLKEIEDMKFKIEKEEQHFSKALENINTQLGQVQSENERSLLEKEREGITQKMVGLEKDKLNVYNREQNTRAGYVYVISNLGAFGEDVYKIGVTRRLDPTERVDELGDASVPFDFDIHAMIFSDDAPSLENAIHKTFEKRRLNMINRRREFFHVTLDEIEKVVKTNFSKSVEFVKLADAAEYRESLMLKESVIVSQ